METTLFGFSSPPQITVGYVFYSPWLSPLVWVTKTKKKLFKLSAVHCSNLRDLLKFTCELYSSFCMQRRYWFFQPCRWHFGCTFITKERVWRGIVHIYSQSEWKKLCWYKQSLSSVWISGFCSLLYVSNGT